LIESWHLLEIENLFPYDSSYCDAPLIVYIDAPLIVYIVST